MTTNSHLIGWNFEDFILEIFPDLTKHPENVQKKIGKCDFESEKFHIEAKASYFDASYGAKIKEGQILLSRNLDKPTLYVLGFHNFKNAPQILSMYKTKWGRIKKIRSEMHIKTLYLVDFEIIEKIWEVKNRIAKSNGEVYMNLRYGFLEQIINNSKLPNFNNVTAHQYFRLEEIPQIHDLINLPLQVLKGTYIGNNCNVLEFLDERKKLKI